MCDSRSRLFHIFKIIISAILVSGMSTVWDGTDGCAKKYRCSLGIYLMTVLSFSYGVIMDCANNAPGHGKNIFYGINVTGKRYFKG